MDGHIIQHVSLFKIAQIKKTPLLNLESIITVMKTNNQQNTNKNAINYKIVEYFL